jgi:hypothetical protein
VEPSGGTENHSLTLLATSVAVLRPAFQKLDAARVGQLEEKCSELLSTGVAPTGPNTG